RRYRRAFTRSSERSALIARRSGWYAGCYAARAPRAAATEREEREREGEGHASEPPPRQHHERRERREAPGLPAARALGRGDLRAGAEERQSRGDPPHPPGDPRQPCPPDGPAP